MVYSIVGHHLHEKQNLYGQSSYSFKTVSTDTAILRLKIFQKIKHLNRSVWSASTTDKMNVNVQASNPTYDFLSGVGMPPLNLKKMCSGVLDA